MSLESALVDYVKRLSGPACIDQLFPTKFIKKNTRFKDAKEFFVPAGVTDQESFDAWIDTNPDDYVRANSDFATWDEMFNQAAKNLANYRQAMLRMEKSIAPAPLDDSPFANITIEINYSPM